MLIVFTSVLFRESSKLWNIFGGNFGARKAVFYADFLVFKIKRHDGMDLCSTKWEIDTNIYFVILSAAGITSIKPSAGVNNLLLYQGPLLLAWVNFNSSVDK